MPRVQVLQLPADRSAAAATALPLASGDTLVVRQAAASNSNRNPAPSHAALPAPAAMPQPPATAPPATQEEQPSAPAAAPGDGLEVPWGEGLRSAVRSILLLVAWLLKTARRHTYMENHDTSGP